MRRTGIILFVFSAFIISSCGFETERERSAGNNIDNSDSGSYDSASDLHALNDDDAPPIQINASDAADANQLVDANNSDTQNQDVVVSDVIINNDVSLAQDVQNQVDVIPQQDVPNQVDVIINPDASQPSDVVLPQDVNNPSDVVVQLPDVPVNPDPNEIDQDNDSFTPNQGDCDDTNARVFPGAVEFPNQIDDDCDGEIDEVAGIEISNDLTINLVANQIVVSGNEANYWTGVFFWTDSGAQDAAGNYYLLVFVRGVLVNNEMTFTLPDPIAYIYFNFASSDGHWMHLNPELPSPVLNQGISYHLDNQQNYSLEVQR